MNAIFYLNTVKINHFANISKTFFNDKYHYKKN